MERVFTELTEECDYTAQYYAVGFDKKEIAEKKTQVVAYDHKPAKDGFRGTWRKERKGIGHKAMRETVRYKG